jgi:DNA-binding transcriptional LysR family regulator
MNNNELMPLLAEMAVFVAVAEEQSFSNAGQKLGMAPSSVSRAINRLESSLQVKLLERTTRRVRLSASGSDVYEQCRAMMNAAKGAVQAAQSTHDAATGMLRIAAPKAFAKQVLSPLILDFIERHPGITLQLKVADHFIDPISEEVDVIFRLTHQPLEGLISKKLASSALVMCASPSYLATNGNLAHPDDLHNHQCITLGEDIGDDQWTFTKEQQQTIVKTKPKLAVNHTEIRKAAVLRNMGVSLFPDFTVKNELQSGELVQVLQDWHVSGNYQGEVLLQYAQSRFIPIQVRVFVDYMKSVFSDEPLKS